MNDAANLLKGVLSEWCALGSIPEVDWRRIRLLDFQEALRTRNMLVTQLDGVACTLCEDFDHHVSVSSVCYTSNLLTCFFM